MSRKNKNPNRQGFLNYCRTIAGIEKDKDEFCKAARIPRGGCDVFKDIDNVILDLNRRHDRGYIGYSAYLSALDKIRSIVAEQNAHELRMAEIETGKTKDEPTESAEYGNDADF